MGERGRRKNRRSIQDHLGSGAALYDTIMVDKCFYVLVTTQELTTPTGNSNVNYRL